MIMVTVSLADGFPCLFPPSSWCLYPNITHFPVFCHFTIFWLVNRPHGVMRATMVSFLVHFFDLCASIFWSFNLPLVLWTNLPIFIDLDVSLSVAVSWLWLVVLPFLLLGSCSYGLGELEVVAIKFLHNCDEVHDLLLLWVHSVPLF